ncbi:hypothetical protein BGZ95_004104 [Linnemannia exigua]|uniref:Uncharacterized protein n=1 Tax=Linnemannia exigua TaxID=604196 RepID=A0AAD4H398_9FUNG|nr:hypothetical protein BGZ95_004104 [Linnemannia exigua]
MAKFTFLLVSAVALVGATVANAASIMAAAPVPNKISPLCYKSTMVLEAKQLIFCGDNCTVWNYTGARQRYLQPDAGGMVDLCRLFSPNQKQNVGAFQFARYQDNKSMFSCVTGQKGAIICKEN